MSGCLSEADIDRLLADDASDSHETRIDAHLDDCPICLERMNARTALPEPVREALERTRRVLGDDHPETLNAVDNMGSILQEQGELDEAEAISWYKKSAENGYLKAQEYLAAGYLEGWFGLPKDAKKAAYWINKIENNQ